MGFSLQGATKVKLFLLKGSLLLCHFEVIFLLSFHIEPSNWADDVICYVLRVLLFFLTGPC